MENKFNKMFEEFNKTLGENIKKAIEQPIEQLKNELAKSLKDIEGDFPKIDFDKLNEIIKHK